MTGATSRLARDTRRSAFRSGVRISRAVRACVCCGASCTGILANSANLTCVRARANNIGPHAGSAVHTCSRRRRANCTGPLAGSALLACVRSGGARYSGIPAAATGHTPDRSWRVLVLSYRTLGADASVRPRGSGVASALRAR